MKITIIDRLGNILTNIDYISFKDDCICAGKYGTKILGENELVIYGRASSENIEEVMKYIHVKLYDVFRHDKDDIFIDLYSLELKEDYNE